ncbi:MAG: YidC/Oxa1 family rane protein insertase [Gaiellaceae bacterium]|nr:YidC/Oxa1 family rane protein insertase [Gaiellaceae bacterium]
MIASIPVFGELEQVLFWGLKELGPDHLGLPWAWAIVGLTIIVRLLLVPVMVRQIHSMQSMQRHMPEMKRIQQLYKDDRAKKQEELMKFYRENKINPAASCLPMLLQLPIFFALYLVLRDHIADEKTHLSWLWIVPNISHAITSTWAGYVLVVIYALSQMASSYYMSASVEKTQRIMMMVLPVFFIYFILKPPVGGTSNGGFPMGLLIYWVTTNLWTVGQGLVLRQLTPKPVPPPKKSSRTAPGATVAKKADATKPATNGARPAQPQVRRVKRKKKGGR